MSAQLFYEIDGSEPVPVGDPAKYQLARPFCDTDGTIGYPFTVTRHDLPTLRPLLSALREKSDGTDGSTRDYFANSVADMETIITQAEAGRSLRFWFEQ